MINQITNNHQAKVQDLWDRVCLPRVIKNKYDFDGIVEMCELDADDVWCLVGESGESLLHHVGLNNLNCVPVLMSLDEVRARLGEKDTNGVSLASYILAGLGTHTGREMQGIGSLFTQIKIANETIINAINLTIKNGNEFGDAVPKFDFAVLWENMPITSLLSIDVEVFEYTMCFAVKNKNWNNIMSMIEASRRCCDSTKLNAKQSIKCPNLSAAYILNNWLVEGAIIWSDIERIRRESKKDLTELVRSGLDWLPWSELLTDVDGFRQVDKRFKEETLLEISHFWNDAPRRIYERLALISENVSSQAQVINKRSAL